MHPPVKTASFSVIQNFERCPYRVYLEKVEKVPQPEIDDDPRHPLVRGDRVHREAEAFIKGEGPLTHDLRHFQPRFEELRTAFEEGRVECEQKWGFTREWEPTDFYADDVWLRVIADVVVHDASGDHVEVIDWKTGKSWNKDVPHAQQRQLYAIAAMMKYPGVAFVKGVHHYLDEGPKKDKVTNYNRNNLVQLLPRWEERLAKLTGALVFPPKNNRGNCRFCPYGPNDAGNGHCTYGVPHDG